MPCVDLSSPTPTEPPPPGGEPTGTRTVNVATSAQLATALAGARPGDLIVMAPGTYTGRYSLTPSGTALQPITLYGPRTAILNGGGIAASPLTVTVRGSYWVLQGFTITNAYQPLFLIGAQHSTVRGLEIYNIGQEAIHIHTAAKNNLIDNNYIHDTGKTNPQFGEGVYVGSAQSHWVSGQPDHTDNNTVSNNVIGPNIGAQMVDVKEGTTGTIVSGNTFNGTGGSINQDAWINAYGNSVRVLNNTGTTARQHGVKVEMLVTGWGQSNVFHGNTWTLGGSATGYGFRVGGGTTGTTVVGCDNTVSGGLGFSNVACTP